MSWIVVLLVHRPFDVTTSALVNPKGAMVAIVGTDRATLLHGAHCIAELPISALLADILVRASSKKRYHIIGIVLTDHAQTYY